MPYYLSGEASKVVCTICSMSLSHTPSKQSMHALWSQLGNGYWGHVYIHVTTHNAGLSESFQVSGCGEKVGGCPEIRCTNDCCKDTIFD